ncbi:MAG TPA: hypothetical protein VGJ87_17875, partial [Roseiflexaceae bacterium]
GQRIGEELAIPVYLYEAAAMRPDRIALPNLRRGEYEELRTAIERDPARAPDFGPARLGPAGATIVGARLPLIAYNIYLNTGDVRVAKRVAKAVRGSSGGLRGVRALGLLVNGRAQVSMNLIDYRTTPLHRAVELVAREAAAYGAAIVESELVGLIPEDALLDAARFYLRLHALREDQVLERRLAQVTNEERRKGTIYPAPTYPAPTNDEHPLCVVGRQWQQTTAMEDQMETSWKLMIEALGASAGELAAAGAGESQARTMLQALGRELLALAGQQADAAGARAAARALLLVAERAAKVAEIATGLSDSGGEAASAARLAQVIALGAQARATPLLPQLPDQELRANFAREFAAHARQSAEFVARVEPILPNPSP